MEKKNQNIIKGIELSKIKVINNFNARQDFGDLEELAEQIRENGLLEPISVIPFSENGEETYMLVNGERRYRAMKLLEEKGVDVGEVPARMLSFGETDDPRAAQAEMYIQQYVRNASKGFTDYENALLFKKLFDAGKSKSEIAKALGKNNGVITYYLNIFDWDPRVQDMIKNGEIGIMNCHRVFKANREKYGDEKYVEKATEELLRIHEKALAKASEESGEKVKATLKDADLFGHVKETKDFIAGMRVLKQYFSDYSRMYPGLNVSIDPTEFYERLVHDNGKTTLKDLFDEAVRQAQVAV
jgi:ParB/RepB/Spo0J family partition protein